MTSIKSLNIADIISADKRISVKKGFLGLTTKYEYIPTASKIKGYKKEYTPNIGEELFNILKLPISQVEELPTSCFAETEMGNYLLEECVSEDRQFVALRLYKFIHLSYEPVTKLTIYEGHNAEILARLTCATEC